jgi:hypothetical protein
MIKPAVRLHLYAMEHAEVVVLAAVTLTFLGRLAFTNPALATAAMALIVALIAHGFMRNTQRLTGYHFVLAVVVLVATSILFPDIAHASLGAMATSLKNDMGAGFDALVYGCYGGGVVSTAVGINNGIKKSKGDQQIQTAGIIGPGLGGPALGMVGYLMNSGAESMGGSSSQMNKLPGGL